MRAIAFVVIGSCLFTLAPAYPETYPLTGIFTGSGRACYGTFALRTKTISWITTFSQCKSVQYELIERGQRDGTLRVTYRLKPATTSCRYVILSLTHTGAEKDIGWEVTGYGRQQSYEADKASGYKAKADDMMSCYLTRDPGK